MVEGIGRKVSLQEQIHVIEMFKEFDFRDEDVSLDQPEVVFRVTENAGTAYWGVQVAATRFNNPARPGANKEQSYHARYSLKKRPYVGPTSTEHELAFLMANQAMVTAGDLVYDPFVGTGSIALALQHFGCHVLGSDIDMRVLRGSKVGRENKPTAESNKNEQGGYDITTNFKHYGMGTPDFLAMDISRPFLSLNRPFLDAIVCDPPYGVRAKTIKTGTECPKARVPQGEDKPYYSQKSAFHFDSLHNHLLEIASKLLVSGGRLVFLYHTDENGNLEAEK